MTAVIAGAPAARSSAAIVWRQARFEARLMMRNGEQVLLTLIIPVVLLVALSLSSIVDLPGSDPTAPRVTSVLPGILALAVMSTAFTALAIATGFDRRAGVVKFLGATPLQRDGFVAAKMISTFLLIAVQTVVLAVVAVVLGWRPGGSAPAVLAITALGTCAFSAWGLLLAGTLRAEATLAVANGIYVLLLLGGGVIVPANELPGPLATIAAVLPSAALGDGLRVAMGATDGSLGLPALVLVLWAAVGSVLAVRSFRWD